MGITIGTKLCRRCSLVKPFDCFHKRSDRKDGLFSECKPCRNLLQAESNRKPKSKRRARNAYLKRHYKVDLQTHDKMLERQQFKCAICRRPFPTSKGTHVDHCHATGKVRGLLCSRCNQGIGLLRDDPEVCSAASEYLRNHATPSPIIGE